MSVLRRCLEWRVVAGLGLVGVAVLLFAPGVIAAAAPLLLVAACPISMLVMLRTMGRPHTAGTPTPVTGLAGADRAAVVREQLAASRHEQDRLVGELEQLAAAGRGWPSTGNAAGDSAARRWTKVPPVRSGHG